MHQWEESVKKERFPHTRNPFTGGDCGWQRGEVSEPWRRAQQQGCGGQSREIPAQRIGADPHSPAREPCLLTCQGGWGLGAKPRASVGSQGEDWGWLREHSLKGASVPWLAKRESGNNSGPAEEARDDCFGVREERRFRALPKQASETVKSHGYQRGPQRQA